MAAGVVSPDRFPTRDPMDKSQKLGRMLNPPRYYEMGGAYTPAIWFRSPRPEGFQQSGPDNIARVEKPTSVKSAHTSSREDD